MTNWKGIFARGNSGPKANGSWACNGGGIHGAKQPQKTDQKSNTNLTTTNNNIEDTRLETESYRWKGILARGNSGSKANGSWACNGHSRF